MIILLICASGLRLSLIDETSPRIPATVIEILRAWAIGGSVRAERLDETATGQPELAEVQMRLQGGVNGDGLPHETECHPSLTLDL
jgi:hypothetical protein